MRLLDIFFSCLLLCALAPFFCLLMMVLRLTGEGEVFYFQERVGLNGCKFNVYKFATMLKNSPNLGTGTITSKNDYRILPVGKFLRKTKINELPQFINILRGDMSLIGPRPHAERDLCGIPKSTLETVIQMKPGISGIGSLIFRSEENILSQFDDPRDFYDNIIAEYKGRLEIWYFENRTFVLNIFLIFLTCYVVVTGRSKDLHRIFKTLPPVPDELKAYL